MLDTLLSVNKRLIINTDLDGVLSGLLLHSAFGCEIVGFSNSADCVWIDHSRIDSVRDAVYIDMFIADPTVPCIDQHIVAADYNHWQQLSSNPLKINPNLMSRCVFLGSGSDAYTIKYPFGTVHFLCALINRDMGLDLRRPLTPGNYSQQLHVGDLFLRADDALTTSLRGSFTNNARQWWQWLRQLGHDNSNITACIDYVNSADTSTVLTVKSAIARLLQGRFDCESPDGGFKHLVDDKGHLLPNVGEYLKFIADTMHMPLFDCNGIFTPHTGNALRMDFNHNHTATLMRLTAQPGPLFSYSFVKGPNSPRNFSYTTHLS